MNIKKIVNAALCAAIASGGVLSNVATPVLASNANDSTLLTYEVTEKYTWTAPADIEFTTGSNGTEIKSGTVEVLENVIADLSVLKISIKPDQAFELTDSSNPDNKRTYTVKNGETTINVGDTVLEVPAGVNTGSADLDFQMNVENTEIAGDYRDVLHFVSEVYLPDYQLVDNDYNGSISKGDIVNFRQGYLYANTVDSATCPTSFIVLNTEGNNTELMARTDYKKTAFNDTLVKVTDSTGTEVPEYKNSVLDVLLNTTYYDSLSDTVKSKIANTTITQNSWDGYGDGETLLTITDASTSPTWKKVGTAGTYERYICAPDLDDIIKCLGASVTRSQIINMFGGTGDVWLRSSNSWEDCMTIINNGEPSVLGYYSNPAGVRPVFTIRLD